MTAFDTAEVRDRTLTAAELQAALRTANQRDQKIEQKEKKLEQRQDKIDHQLNNLKKREAQ